MQNNGGRNINSISNKRREKIERNLALQFGIIAVIFVIYEVAFVVSTIFLLDSRYFNLFLTLFYIVFISCNPYVYLIFNSAIRLHFSQLFCRCYFNKVDPAVRISAPSTEWPLQLSAWFSFVNSTFWFNFVSNEMISIWFWWNCRMSYCLREKVGLDWSCIWYLMEFVR